MTQVIGIPVGSDSGPFFANLFLAHKEANWVEAQSKLGTINVRKINNSFRFIDDLVSLNDGSTFEKHYKDIFTTELKLKKENSTRLFDKRDNFGFDIVRMPFDCSNVSSKMFYGILEQSFLEFLEQPVKLKIFLVIVSSC